MRPRLKPPLSAPIIVLISAGVIFSCGYAAVRLFGPWPTLSHLSATGIGIALGFVGGVAVMLADDDPELYSRRDTGELVRSREGGIATVLRMGPGDDSCGPGDWR